jgi:flagellar biosynthesis chaperone FliJ
MSRRDPLEVLAKLRGLARDTARRSLAEAQRGLAAAELADRQVAGALLREAVAAPAEYAAWLPAAALARDRTAAALRQAGATETLARAELVAARAAAEAVEAMLAARREARRNARLATEQRILDDLRPVG